MPPAPREDSTSYGPRRPPGKTSMRRRACARLWSDYRSLSRTPIEGATRGAETKLTTDLRPRRPALCRIAKDQQQPAQTERVAVTQSGRSLQTLLAQVRAVLASEVLEHHLGARDDYARMTT